MARDTKTTWVATRWASGAALLLVPVLAVLFLGSDCLALQQTGAAGFLDLKAFAPQARSQAKPAARRAQPDGDAVDVHLNVWENTADRRSIRV